MRKGWLVVAGLTLMASSGVAGLFYGPPEPYAEIQNAITRNGTDQIAVVDIQQIRRQPKGIATFPDGGAPRILESAIVIYLIRADDMSIAKLAEIPQPSDIAVSMTAFAEGWVDDKLYITVSGRTGTSVADFKKPPSRHYYRIGPDGSVAVLPETPKNIPAREETPTTPKASTNLYYMAISTGNQPQISTFFVVDKNGELARYTGERPPLAGEYDPFRHD